MLCRFELSRLFGRQPRSFPFQGYFLFGGQLSRINRLLAFPVAMVLSPFQRSTGYCTRWGGTTAQPPFVPLTRVAVADWMDVSAAILGKVLIDSGVLAQAGTPSTS